jgi:hypothetical protein
MPSAPAAPCALGVVIMHTGVHSGGTGITRHSRTRMVLTAYGALSPATNSSFHRRRRMHGLARPVGLSKTFADLTPATGARTTRFCRPLQRRSSCAFADHSRAKPALRSRFARNAAASTASHPNVRDDREAPLLVRRDARTYKSDLPDGLSEIFFARGLDRNSRTLPVGQITWRTKIVKWLRRSHFLIHPRLGLLHNHAKTKTAGPCPAVQKPIAVPG